MKAEVVLFNYWLIGSTGTTQAGPEQLIHSELTGSVSYSAVSEVMSQEIGLQRHVAFADPKLERSTAVKCSEADNYISTTARSAISVLPFSLFLFKSPS